MKKEKYEQPVILAVFFEQEDVLTTSSEATLETPEKEI